MDEKRVIDLVVLYCKDELLSSEVRELQDWLQEDDKHREVFQGYLNQYRRTRKIAFCDKMDEEVAWKEVRRRIIRPERRSGMYRYARVAAVVAACVLLGGIAFHLTRNFLPASVVVAELKPGTQKAILKMSDGLKINLTDTASFVIIERNGVRIEKNEGGQINYEKEGQFASVETLFNTIEVPRAGEYFLVLSDGTRVWLNAESELRFPVVFDSLQREVYLTGEAYFEVTKEELRPFTVKCKNGEVRVLGTKFNVLAYEGHQDMVTTLLEGSVEVSEQGRVCVLKPGQQAILKNGQIQVKEVDAEIYMAWASGVFEFENRPLHDITEQLGRWYDVEFVYSGKEIKEITFTGAASRHGDLTVILGMIERLAKVKFTRDENRIVVTKR